MPGMPADLLYRDILLATNGDLWVATNHGLLRYAGGNWAHFTQADGLRNDDLDALAAREGALWAAYRDSIGLSRFHLVNGRLADGEPGCRQRRWMGSALTTRDGFGRTPTRAFTCWTMASGAG